jgi:LytS/YehU family sensor histidine kinase
MYKDKLNELANSVLLDASQLAFIEEAPKTFKLLDSYLKFLRYLTKEKEIECLDNEVEAIEHYISIQKIHYDFDFRLTINKDEMLKTLFITKSNLIMFVDNILSNILSGEERFIGAELKFDIQNEQVKAILMVSYLGKVETFDTLL